MAIINLNQVEEVSQHYFSYYIHGLSGPVACMGACLARAQQIARVFQTYDKGWIEEKTQLGEDRPTAFQEFV